MMVLHIILRKLTAVFLAQQGKIIGGKVLLMVDIPDVLFIHKDAPHSRYIPCAVLFRIPAIQFLCNLHSTCSDQKTVVNVADDFRFALNGNQLTFLLFVAER